MAPRVFIVVLNWNGWKDTIECLESLQKLDYPNFRLVVIDNGSSDDSWDRIKGWASGNEPVESRYVAYRRHKKPLKVVSYSKVEAEAGGTKEPENVLADIPSDRALVLVRNGANLGFAGGCNVGTRYAMKRGAGYAWFLNNDTVVDPKALSEMITVVRANARVGLVGSVLKDYYAPHAVQAYGGGRVRLRIGTSRHFTAPVPSDRLSYVAGTSLLIRRATLESVGLLDDDFFMYWEDADYGLRARMAGWRLAVAPGSKIWHKESSALDTKRPVLDGYFNASAIRFFKKHSSLPILPIAIGVGGRLMKRVLRRDWKRARAVCKAAFAAWRRG